MKRLTTVLPLFVLAVALVLVFSHRTGSEEQQASEEVTITVGSISLTIAEEVEEFQPITDYLARHLRGAGITKGRVIVTHTIKEMAELMKAGEVDIYIDSPFPIARVAELSGAKPFLRRWKRGVAEYHSLIFVRKDSGIEDLAGLKGKSLAFDAPSSTTGYFIPKAMLVNAGVPPVEILKLSDEIPLSGVGYIFSNDDENTMFWVLKHKTNAGAMDNIHFEKISGARRDELKILARSEDIPRHVVAHRAGLSPALLEEIERVLVGMNEDPEGAKVLVEFQRTKKFDKFPQGADAAIRPIVETMRLIDAESAP